MRALVPAAVRRSRRIIVDAATTRDDLRRAPRRAAGKIDVVPLGVSAPGAGVPAGPLRARARPSASAPSCSASRPSGRTRILRACCEPLAAIPPERRPLLVIPATRRRTKASCRRALARSASNADMICIGVAAGGTSSRSSTRRPAALVFPSLYEGFGLPVLEAMARGVPVACSDRSVVPEVAGDAALLFDPTDARAITAAIERLLARRRARAPARPAAAASSVRVHLGAHGALDVAAYDRALRALTCRRLLGDRPSAMIARNVLGPATTRRSAHAAALPAARDAARRYLLARGVYPYAARPHAERHRGPAPVLPHDFITLVEVFCRQDYGQPRPGWSSTSAPTSGSARCTS